MIVACSSYVSFLRHVNEYVLASIFLQTAAGIARGLGNNTVYAAGNFISAFVMIVLNILFVAIMRLGVSAMLVSQIVGPLIGGTSNGVYYNDWILLRQKG